MMAPSAPPVMDGAAALGVPRVVRACLFVLAGQPFAIDVASAREVVIVEEFTRVPRAPSHLVGVTNLRGYILPIFDIRPLLGLPSLVPGLGTRVVVTEAASVQVGIVIEAVLGLESFDEIVPFGDAVRREYGEFGVGLLRRGEGVVTLLDSARLLEALSRGGKGA